MYTSESLSKNRKNAFIISCHVQTPYSVSFLCLDSEESERRVVMECVLSPVVPFLSLRELQLAAVNHNRN